MERLSRVILRLRILILIAAFAVTVWLGSYIPRIQFDSSSEGSIPRGDPEQIFFEEAMAGKTSPEAVVREIRRKTRRKFSSEEKIRIVLEGLWGEKSTAAICRREGINPHSHHLQPLDS